MVTRGNSCCSSNISTSSQVPLLVSVQEKGSRNKRKYEADPPLVDQSNLLSSSHTECLSYELSMEKSQNNLSHEQQCVCDSSGLNQDQIDTLKQGLILSDAPGPSDVGPGWPREELESEDFQDTDWSDHTESQLEELILSNLDAIFKSAIKKITACGYTEEVATKSILRPGLCYGYKDTVSNIVDKTLTFLRNGQNIDSLRENLFEDLPQLEKYTLAEMICVLKEVRPFISIGDAMWCLLICDFNLAHACAKDGDPLSSFGDDEAAGGSSSVSTVSQLKSEAKQSELNLPNLNKTNPILPCPHNSQSETLTMTGIPNSPNPGNPLVFEGLSSEKEGPISSADNVQKSSGVTEDCVQTKSLSSVPEEKTGARKSHSNSTKRESILRQKPLHLEKNYRSYGSKGASRTRKLSGLGSSILDKKLKPVSDSIDVNAKASSSKTSKTVGIIASQADGNHNLAINAGLSMSLANNPKSVNIPPALPIANTQSALPTANTPSSFLTANTELSLSLPSRSSSLPSRSSTASKALSCNSEAFNCSYAGIPYDNTMGKWVPRDEQDEMTLKLVSQMQELQNQLQGWTEWANQKVMEAARRLSKDKAELKILRQEKDEAVRLKKEENTMKKLSEMEHALDKACGQAEQANSAVQSLEMENSHLRQEMEVAKSQAAEAAASCENALNCEKKTRKKLQSLEMEKTLLQEELVTEKWKRVQLEEEVDQAKDSQDQLEVKWKQEEKAKEELLVRASSIRKEREQIEALGKEKEDLIRQKAEDQLLRYKDDIQKLESEISQLRLKTDSSKIAALRRNMDGSYASHLANGSVSGLKENQTPSISKTMADLWDYLGTEDLKREWECVMCLSEERSVVFLPCAHQVVCTTCNELHEKQVMKDCPSCRTPIEWRISARFAHD